MDSAKNVSDKRWGVGRIFTWALLIVLILLTLLPIWISSSRPHSCRNASAVQQRE